MKPDRLFLTVLVTIFSFQMLFPQQPSQPVFVIVHGAWGGGWAFKKVDSLLTASGALVYRPTLTGLGERVHLASQSVGLDTHILDVVNTILFEELDDIVLVGHSYGGMVVTGVSDSLPDRIREIIYLDAFLPNDGESLQSIVEATGGEPMGVTDGFVVPPWVPAGKPPPKDVPHPYRTWVDVLVLDNPDRLQVPATYILNVNKGMDPAAADFATQADRARQKGWSVKFLESDHNPQWSAPEELVKLLLEISH